MRQVCRSGHLQGVRGFKSQEKKPSPQRKIQTKNDAFSRWSMAFKEIPPTFPLRSALPLARAGVEVAAQEHDLDSIKSITSMSEQEGSLPLFVQGCGTKWKGRQTKG